MTTKRHLTIQRRARTVPSMLGATFVAFGLFPVLAPIVIIADLIRARRKSPTLRVYLFVLQYLLNDSVEILLAPILWALAGFGTTIRKPASVRRHEQLQWWSAQMLQRRAAQLLELRMECDSVSEAALLPAPVIVIGRHASILDASLAGLSYVGRGVSVRGVIMAELLADPGFDIVYSRVGSVFIDRSDGGSALELVKTMTSEAPDSTAYVLFPEGRLFRPGLGARLTDRIRTTDPERAERLAPLRHLLPPRPGGALALLQALPETDVVLFDHEGLDQITSLGDLINAVPFAAPIRVTAKRFKRREIPQGSAAQTSWLDECWLTLDNQLNERRKLS